MTEDINLSEHLEELRTRFIVSIVSVVILTVLSFLISDLLVAVITAPIKQSVSTLYFLSPYEAFITKLQISLVGGIILSLPIIFSQIWLFVSPGLNTRERKAVFPVILFSSLLFALGVLFAYFLVIPFALKFFLDFQTPSLQPLISIHFYISFFLSLILTFGIIFDLPVLVVGLVILKIVNVEFLTCQRKPVILIIFILAAILTPTVDIFTQCLLAFPLWFLFELSLWIAKRIDGRPRSRDF